MYKKYLPLIANGVWNMYKRPMRVAHILSMLYTVHRFVWIYTYGLENKVVGP